MSKFAAVGLDMAILAGFVLSQASAQRVAGVGKPTATPVKHLVVIFDENCSFDRCFETSRRA